MAAPVAVTVSLSHDGSSWSDVSAYVSAAPLSFQRGRSRALGEWQPGTFNLPVLNFARAIDPTNDAATFQSRPGDHIKIALGGTTHWRGRVRQASVKYERGGTYPTSRLILSGSDGLSTLAKATVTDLVDSVVGYGTYYTGSLIGLVLALSSLDYFNASTIDAGDVVTSLPDTGTFNALTVIQTCTRTEGGNSQLFTLKDGTLRWRSRYARPSQVVVFGGSGIPIRDADMDYTDEEWANRVSLTMAQHVDPDQTSSTSVTSGTGTKNFTLDALTSDGFGFSAGAAVYVESLGSPGNNMTGTVTSFVESTRALVCNITSKNGSSTRTDWVFTFTEPATTVTASDAQSRATFDEYITPPDIATYHRNAVVAAAEATLIAASRAYPSRRISSIDVELARLSSAQRSSVLGLEIGDALDVSIALGAGTPSTLRQVRQIDGIAHQISGSGSHLVTFTLGNEATVNWTATLKQNGTTKTTSAPLVVYTVNDDWCEASFYFSAQQTGTINTEVKVTPTGLPLPSVSGHMAVGTFLFAGSGGNASGVVRWDGTDLTFRVHNSSTPLGQTPNFALAVNDLLAGSLSFPIA